MNGIINAPIVKRANDQNTIAIHSLIIRRLTILDGVLVCLDLQDNCEGSLIC